MKLKWGFLCVCLCHIISVVWGQNFNPRPRNQRPASAPQASVPINIPPEDIREAFSRASEMIDARRTVVAAGFAGGAGASRSQGRSTAAARHLRFQASSPRSQTLEGVQQRFEVVTENLASGYSAAPQQVSAFSAIDLRSALQDNTVKDCSDLFDFSCRRNDKYRTVDGSCNNLQHPSWGVAGSCFERLVDPDYSDGISGKRRAQSGNELPAPRRLSLEVHSHFDNPTEHATHMFMAWGQFLVHDISLAPLAQGSDNELLECCSTSHPSCDPIFLQSDDPFFSLFNTTCIENSRSAICPTCTLGPRQQINQVTSYIDASHIYGLNLNETRSLRTNDGSGTLRIVNNREAGELLPPSSNPNDVECSSQDPNFDCFEAGDTRVNQHPALTSLHTLFVREHNRIARSLREINPRWDGETLFQEARRIVGAEMQMIAYNEYLPLVLGREGREYYDLSVRGHNEYTEYDDTVQATLANEFSAAACRFGHSMINGFFRETRGNSEGNWLRDTYNYPFGLYTGQLEGVMEGLTVSPSQKFERHIVRDVTNHLYQVRGDTSGLDLAAININRGRDHGIPGYTTLLEYCGGPTITRWRDLDRLLYSGMSQQLESLYERVEDIDLFTGGLAERPYNGAVMGPTFRCIIGMQFYHLKYGDRFYFEHGGQAGSFTPAQLRELKKVTLGKVMCDNMRIEEMTENVFLYEGKWNCKEKCNRKESMDLNAWRDSNNFRVKC